MQWMEGLVGPPAGTQWSKLDVLAEVARVATIEYDQKKGIHRRRILLVRFNTGAKKNDCQMRKGTDPLTLPTGCLTGQGFLIEKKNAKCDLFGFVPKKLQSATMKKTERDSSLTQKNPIKRPIEFVDDHEEKTKPKKQKKMSNLDHPGNSLLAFPNELPVEFNNVIRNMNGTDATLIIQKTLFKTDVSKTHGRLSIPLNHVINRGFLTSDEEKVIDTYCKGKSKADLSVVLMDPLFRKVSVKLRRWDMKKKSGSTSSTYALVCGWNEVVEANGLKEGDAVQLWSFRSDSRLCFGLVKASEGKVKKEAE